MKQIFCVIFPLTVLFSSCHQKDEKFCSCMEKSNEVNRLSEKIWSLSGSKNDSISLKKLIDLKKNLCEQYASKNGDELLELKQGCK